MRFVLATAIVIIFGVTSGLAAPIKVVSWNMQWFPGGKPKASASAKQQHMKKAQEALKQINPDVLCLQEVKDWAAVEELVSVLPGFQVDIVSQFWGDQQQAIASRLPVDSAWYEDWKSGGESDPPRGYSFAALKLPDDTFLLVYSVHMKANGYGDNSTNISKREESARQLVAHSYEMKELYGQRGKAGIVLAGDWNTTLDPNPRFDTEQTLRETIAGGFRSGWEGIPFEQRITHPAEGNWPAITFDYILTNGLKVSPATIMDFPEVSDHNPVVLAVDGVTESALIVQPSPTPEPAPLEPAGDTPIAEISEEMEMPVRQMRISVPTFDGSEIPGYKPKPSPAR